MNDRELEDLYRRASAQDLERPGATVRQAILANASRLAAERATATRLRPRLATQLAAIGARIGARVVRKFGAARPPGRWHILGPLVAAALASAIIIPILRDFPEQVRAPAPGPESRSGRRETSRSPTELASRAQSESQSTEQAAKDAAAAFPPEARAPLSGAAAAPSANTAPQAPSGLAPTQGTSRAAPATTDALLQAAAAGDTARLRLLLNATAALEAKDSLGRTALMLATLYGHAASVDALLSHGANPNATDYDGRTPLQVARNKHDAAIISALMRAGGH